MNRILLAGAALAAVVAAPASAQNRNQPTASAQSPAVAYLASTPADQQPDVVLDIPNLSVESITLEVQGLDAHVSLEVVPQHHLHHVVPGRSGEPPLEDPGHVLGHRHAHVPRPPRRQRQHGVGERGPLAIDHRSPPDCCGPPGARATRAIVTKPSGSGSTAGDVAALVLDRARWLGLVVPDSEPAQ